MRESVLAVYRLDLPVAWKALWIARIEWPLLLMGSGRIERGGYPGTFRRVITAHSFRSGSALVSDRDVTGVTSRINIRSSK